MNKKSELSKYMILIALLSSCTPPTPEEERKAYNKKLGSQGEVTATHLFIRSPGNDFGMAPVTLKIPRAYLANSPVYKNPHKDQIDNVNFIYTFPEGTPWKDIPHVSAFSSGEDIVKGRDYYKKYVFVILKMESPNLNIEYYRRESRDKEYYWPNTPMAGLERYNAYRCYEKGQIMPIKEPDDTTPANCRLDKNWYYLITPDSVTDANKTVGMMCAGGSCIVNFNAGRRVAEISILEDFIPQWPQRVDIARQLINGFVVDK